MASAIDSTLGGDLTGTGSLNKSNLQTALAAAASEISALQTKSAVFATVTANIANVTGDGTAYTVVFGAAVTDNLSEWNGSDTFTAAAAGFYWITVHVAITGMTSNNTVGLLSVVAGDYTFRYDIDPFDAQTSNSIVSLVVSAGVPLSASDTVQAVLTVSATDKGVDVIGTGATENSWISIVRVSD